MRIQDFNFTKKNIILTLFILSVSLMVYSTIDIILIFLSAMIVAYLLNPIVKCFERLKIGRTFSVVLLMLLTVFIIFILLSLVLPILIDDIIYFSNKVPLYVSKFFAFSQNILTELKIQVSLESVRTFITDRLGAISKYTLETLTNAAASAKNLAMLLMNIVLMPVLVFFFLKDYKDVKDFINKIVKKFKLESFVSHFAEFENIIGRYFKGMFLVGLILSALYSTVLLIVDVKPAILLGILTGMGGLIPYVGFTIGLIVSVTFAAVQFQDFVHPLYILIGFSIVQMLESFVITPKIVGDSLGLNPVLVIFSLMIGGALFGLIGMIIALPIAAFIKIILSKKLP